MHMLWAGSVHALTLRQLLSMESMGVGLGRTTLASSLPHSRADHRSTISNLTKPRDKKNINKFNKFTIFPLFIPKCAQIWQWTTPEMDNNRILHSSCTEISNSSLKHPSWQVFVYTNEHFVTWAVQSCNPWSGRRYLCHHHSVSKLLTATHLQQKHEQEDAELFNFTAVCIRNKQLKEQK